MFFLSIFCRFLLQLGVQHQSKIHPKITHQASQQAKSQNSKNLQIPLVSASLTPLIRETPSWLQVRSKLAQVGTKVDQNPSQERSKTCSKFNLVYDALICWFWTDFGPNMAPKTTSKWSQVASKIDSFWSIVLEAFFGWMLDTFFTIFGAILREARCPKL